MALCVIFYPAENLQKKIHGRRSPGEVQLSTDLGTGTDQTIQGVVDREIPTWLSRRILAILSGAVTLVFDLWGLIRVSFNEMFRPNCGLPVFYCSFISRAVLLELNFEPLDVPLCYVNSATVGGLSSLDLRWCCRPSPQEDETPSLITCRHVSAESRGGFTLFPLWFNLTKALWHATRLFGDRLKVRRTLKASEGFILSAPPPSR